MAEVGLEPGFIAARAHVLNHYPIPPPLGNYGDSLSVGCCELTVASFGSSPRQGPSHHLQPHGKLSVQAESLAGRAAVWGESVQYLRALPTHCHASVLCPPSSFTSNEGNFF